ncbi:MAG: cellulase family glycosylhydrolase [Calditrichae bacterium]|nr:cellulase family glycosylhydrolase [Calditrichia bacterium]
MKTISSFFILVFLLFGQMYSETPDSRFLHTKGFDIVDGKGEKILLRGVGLGNWLLPEGYMWKFGQEGDRPRKIEKLVSDLIGEQEAQKFWKRFRENYITEQDIKRIADLGFNSVRPALNARLFLTEAENAEYIEENFVLIDNLIEWCRKYNIYVILDMHGAPGGQTGANIDDSPKDEPELFMDQRNQERLIDLWVKIAERYKDEPIVAAYDLLNEPLPERTGAAEKYGHLAEPLYKRITQAIRKVDKNHMITLEGINWANDWSIFGKPFDDNVFYQFHYYCWNRPDNLNDISYFLKHRERLNAPVWVGETGEKGNTIYWATTQYFEKNNIGWSFWPWKKMDTRNTPYSINKPNNWDKISAYSKGEQKPDAKLALNVLNQLIENIKLENCVYFPDVVNSIMRRLPVKIQAENYGHDGFGKSFFVADTSNKAMTYRVTEAVPIELIDFKEGQYWSEQCIVLGKGEWTKYSVKNDNPEQFSVLLRLKKNSEKATFTISVNNYSQSLEIRENGWQEIKLQDLKFNKPDNVITFHVNEGIIALDWIDIFQPE